MRRALATFLLIISVARASTKFVDSAATGTGTGASWANAWTSPSSMTGLVTGDIVEFNGGGSGNTITYNLAGNWAAVVSGSSAGSRITYRIGQDGIHNGTVVFHSTAAGVWVSGKNNITISGDAGDGARHFSVTGYAGGIEGNAATNVKLEYTTIVDTIECTNFAKSGSTGATGLEISHCYLEVTDTSADHVLSAVISGTGYDDSTIHDCTIVMLVNTNGFGVDGIQWNGSGYSAYNNTITGNVTGTYLGSQHADGWQSTGGNAAGSGPASYIKFYNNSFLNVPNYGLYAEGTSNGGFQHMIVYNNVMQITNATIQSGTPRGIAFLNHFNGNTYDDIVIANNLAADFTQTNHAIDFKNEGFTGTFSNDFCYNNIAINGGGFDPENTVTIAHNVSFTSGQAAGPFVSYTASGSSNNFRLTSLATTLIGQGTTVSGSFTTDADGVTRTVPWEIGPYKYTAGSAPALANGNKLRGGSAGGF